MRTKKNNNIILKMQDILVRELDRLDNDNFMEENSKEELKRSTAISQSANTIIKTVDLNMKILKFANQTQNALDDVNNVLGITDE